MALILFVTGPAGTGKTSFCTNFYRYLGDLGKEAYYINLDPSALAKIEYLFDIGDYFPSRRTMKEESLGPNGSLIRSLEYLSENIQEMEIFEFSDNSIVLVDCPGQVELYMHYDLIPKIVSRFLDHNNQCAILYLIESHYLNNFEKFISACTSCLVTFSLFGLPQINIISKMDLICESFSSDNNLIELYYEKYNDFFSLDVNAIKEKLRGTKNVKYENLIQKLVELVEICGIGEFIPYDVKNLELNEFIFLKICEATNFSFEEELVEHSDDIS